MYNSNIFQFLFVIIVQERAEKNLFGAHSRFSYHSFINIDWKMLFLGSGLRENEDSW